NTEQQRIEAMKQLILDEVNVKEIEFVDGAGMLVKKVKCNFRTMGKKFGKQMKAVAAAVAAMNQEHIAMLEQGSVTLPVDGADVLIELEDVDIYSEDIPGWSVSNAGTLTVALDLSVTEQLRLEGMAREMIRTIQQLRKDSGFEITDRIIVTIPDTEEGRACLDANRDYIASQVLAKDIRFGGDAITVEKV
ncbi:MAG: isoleucine--tRNA ligase, partial [Bacteroidaceae bacterium]|nr:isoleucine--tRNA ligase [Bacteroidaceae bacterium]